MKFDKEKVIFDIRAAGMFMRYEGLGEEKIPETLMDELRQEAKRGNPKSPEYYYTEEFIDRCIEHFKK